MVGEEVFFFLPPGSDSSSKPRHKKPREKKEKKENWNQYRVVGRNRLKLCWSPMKTTRDSKLMRKYLSRVYDYPPPLRIKIDTERKRECLKCW